MTITWKEEEKKKKKPSFQVSRTGEKEKEQLYPLDGMREEKKKNSWNTSWCKTAEQKREREEEKELESGLELTGPQKYLDGQ